MNREGILSFDTIEEALQVIAKAEQKEVQERIKPAHTEVGAKTGDKDGWSVAQLWKYLEQ